MIGIDISMLKDGGQGKDVAMIMKAQRRNMQTAMVLGGIIKPVGTSPAPAYL